MNEKVRVLGIAPGESVPVLKGILDCPDICCAGVYGYDEAQLPVMCEPPFDAVVAYSECMAGEDEAFLEKLYMYRKDAARLLLSDGTGQEILEKAMHCGMTRVLPAETDPDEICREVLLETARNRERSEKQSGTAQAKVITFCSAKGGAGKTAAAVNTAAVLAGMGKRVCLIDTDLRSGDAAWHLNVAGRENLAALAEKNGLTSAELRECIAKSGCGAYVIPSPCEPDAGESVSPQAVLRIISMLQDGYEYIITDTASALDGMNISLMDRSDAVYFVITPELSSLRAAGNCLKALDRYGLSGKVRLILNRAGNSIVNAADAEKALGRRPCGIIPYDPAAMMNAESGNEPAAACSPGGKAGKAFAGFVRSEFGEGKTEKRGLFGMKLGAGPKNARENGGKTELGN